MGLEGLNPTPYTSLIDFINSALNVVIAISALLAVGMIVYAGIRYILAAGDDKKIEEATKNIIYTLIGLVVVFIAPLVIKFILSTFLNQI